MASPPPAKKLVIVIAGPTAVGKSKVAAEICSPEVASSILREHAANNHNHTHTECTSRSTGSIKTRGHIVSADSVQAHRGVQSEPTNRRWRRERAHPTISSIS